MGQNDVRRFPPLARTLTLVPWIIISLAKSKFPSFPLILQRSTGSCYFEDSFEIKKLSQFKGLKSPASPFALILSSSPFSYSQWEFSSSWKFSVNHWSLQTCCSISLRPSEIQMLLSRRRFLRILKVYSITLPVKTSSQVCCSPAELLAPLVKGLFSSLKSSRSLSFRTCGASNHGSSVLYRETLLLCTFLY